MSIEYFSFFDQATNINTNQFVEGLKQNTRCKNMKIIFIHHPKIKNLQQTNIDLLLIIAVENKAGNYYKVQKDTQNKNCYLFNVIIPIKFVCGYEDSNVNILNDNTDPKNYNVLINNEIEMDFSSEIDEMRFSTEKYLKNIWKDYKHIFINPLIWIYSNNTSDGVSYKFNVSNIILAPKFGYWEISAYLNYGSFTNGKTIYKSINEWSLPNTHESYEKIDNDINMLVNKLKHENELGFLTKSKIDRINKLYSDDLKIYEKYLTEIDKTTDIESFELTNQKQSKKSKLTTRILADKEIQNNLIIISGKAGSGKTSELLLLIKKRLEDKQATRYITYNKLLVNQVKNIVTNSKISFNFTQFSAISIHKQIYRYGRNFGNILFIMTYKRIKELENSQQIKQNNLLNCLQNAHVSYIDLNDIINNNQQLFNIIRHHYSEDLYDFTYYFIKDLQTKYPQKDRIDNHEIKKYLEEYTQKTIDKISNGFQNNVFLRDYYNVLSNILLILRDSDTFYDEFKLASFSPSDWHKVASRGGKSENIIYQNNKDDFRKLVNRSRGSFSRYVPFIDEAQDCHDLERDIFFELYHKKNMVVATGGQEQLIRHEHECNWKVDSTGRNHNIIEIEKKNNTFRLGQKHIDLCNYLASEFEIDLNLKPSHLNDGELIIDIMGFNEANILNNFKSFAEKGKQNGYFPSESVMVIIESSSTKIFQKHQTYENDNFIINEHNNVVLKNERHGDKKCLLQQIINNGKPDNRQDYRVFYHNMNNQSVDDTEYDNDEEFGIDEYIALFYESCRGSEAFSVMCLELDEFYERKKQDTIASKFLSEDLLLTENQRKQKYAMTWVLMALTRAIDTLYIQISDSNSELGKIFQKYIDSK